MNRLPPEVLAICATFVSDTDPRPIIFLTHVCRYWRRSITSDPRSWASIGSGWKRLAPLCLERAGVVPLAVDITVSDVWGGEGFFKSLLPQTSRIGRLRLAGYSFIEAVADDLPGFFDSPMPKLTSLELQQSVEPDALFPPRGAPVPPIFHNVGKLESLSLTRTPLYPPVFGIASLRELKLLGYTDPFHFGTFLGFLESNPGLERVVLNIQFAADSVKKASTREVTFPRLRYLSITCSKPIDSRRLLSCMPFPRGAHVEVISTRTDQSARFGSFLPSSPRHIRKLLTPITAIKTQITPREFQLSGNGSKFTFRSPQALFDTDTELVLFSGAAVRELYASTHPFKYTYAGLSRKLELLPSLETLVFSKTAFASGMFSMLAKEPVLCPRLKTITFFDCGIDSKATRELGKAMAKRKATTAIRLHRVVIITNAGMPPDLASVRQLQKSVPCVEVRVDDKLPDFL